MFTWYESMNMTLVFRNFDIPKIAKEMNFDNRKDQMRYYMNKNDYAILEIQKFDGITPDNQSTYQVYRFCDMERSYRAKQNRLIEKEKKKREDIMRNQQYQFSKILYECARLGHILFRIETLLECDVKLVCKSLKPLFGPEQIRSGILQDDEIIIYKAIAGKNQMIYECYKKMIEYHIKMKGRAYAIDKYEQPLWKIGLPYDVIRVILTYLLSPSIYRL